MAKQLTTYLGKVIGSKLSVKAGNWSHVYIYEPAIEEIAEQRGNLYLVLDMPSEYEPLGKGIIETLRQFYFDDLEGEALQRLEEALAQANRKIEEFNSRLVSSKQESMRRIHITCIVLVDQDLHLAQIGESHIYLVRRDKLNKISNTSAPEQSAVQSFQNIASGRIEIGDILTVSTARLFEAIPLAQFKEIVTTCYPSVAGSRLTDLLTKKKKSLDNVPSALILEVNQEGSAVQPERLGTEEKSNQDSLANKVKHSKDAIAARMHDETVSPPPAVTPQQAEEPAQPVMTAKPTHWDETEDAGMPSFAGIWTAVSGFFGNLVDVVSGREDPGKLSKVFLILGLALVLFVSYQVMSTRQTENPIVQSNQDYTEAYESFNQAREFMRSNDFINARDHLLVAQAKALEAEGQNISPELTRQLLSDIQSELDRLDGVTRLTDLDVLADLSELREGASGDQIVRLDDIFYVLDESGQRLFRVDGQSREVTVELDPILETQRAQQVTAAEGRIYFMTTSLDGETGVHRYDPQQSSMTEIAFASGALLTPVTVFGNWVDASSNVRLYSTGMDDTAGLWRYRFQGNQLTAGQDVIEPDTARPEFSTVVDFAIDGNVYFLTKGGQIIRYTAGNLDEEFRLRGSEPDKEVLENPVAMATTTQGDLAAATTGQRLYVADRGNNRVAIFGKEDGQLNKIYAAENAFTDLRDVLVDEQNNLLYVLDGDKIYRVQL